LVLWMMVFPASAAGAREGAPADPPEKIFLQTDREVYIAGEDLFYKLDLRGGQERYGPAGEIVYLALRNVRNTVITHAMIRTHGKKAWGSLYLPDTLSTGMYQLTAYTNVMRNYGEGSFFTGDIFIANRFDKALTAIWKYAGKTDVPPHGERDTIPDLPERRSEGLLVATDKEQYDNRGKITLRIAYSPAEGEDAPVSLSVTVAETYSRLPPATKRSAASEAAGREKERTAPRLPEYEGYILRGKVLKEDGSVAPGVYVMLSVPDSMVNLDYAITDSSGMFRFLLNDFYFGKKIILTPQDLSRQTGYKILTGDKFEILRPYEPPGVFFPPGFKTYLSRCQEIVGVQKIYQQKIVLQEENEGMKKGIRPLVYSRPSLTVVPAEYTPLKDLPEIAKEIIPFLKVRKKKEKYEVRVLDVPAQKFFKENAVMFLDGVPVNDFRQLVPLGSKQIERIEIVGRRWYYGDIRFPGILAVFTRNHAIGAYRFPPEVLSFTMEKPAPFTTMDCRQQDPSDDGNAVLPDLRQVLCWIPDIELKKKDEKTLSFYSGDLSGSYTVEVTGVTGKGTRIAATTRFTVGPQKNSTEKAGGMK